MIIDNSVKDIEKTCVICSNKYMTNIADLIPCPNCGWYNDLFCEVNPNKVIYRNCISYNKAKKLYEEGKPLIPNINDFMEMLYSYSEVEFTYNNQVYGVILTKDGNKHILIKMFVVNGGAVGKFKDKNDFIENAKIDDKYLKDIWDIEVKNVNWLQ